MKDVDGSVQVRISRLPDDVHGFRAEAEVAIYVSLAIVQHLRIGHRRAVCSSETGMWSGAAVRQ